MLINRLIEMYGLRHKHIRIEDQQLNLKMNKMVFVLKIDNSFVNPIKLFPKLACFGIKIFENKVFLQIIQLSR